MQPKNWPQKYIYSPESVGVDLHIAMLRLALSSSRQEDQDVITPCIEEKRAHPHLEIRKITSHLFYKGPHPHPLATLKGPGGSDQHGLFATKKIPKGAALGECVGELYLFSQHAAREKKDASYNWIVKWKNETLLCIDARKIANEMMYINDYRGLQDLPNAHLTWLINRGLYYVGYAASRDILAHEEILTDYGREKGF